MSRRQVLLAIVAASLLAGFMALGSWQLQRRAWKHDLIARVEQRVGAPAVAAPGPDRWSQVDAAHDEYRHVRLSGRFLHDRETLVQAVTSLGGGFWVLSPLQTADGTVLVNRGFVPSRQRALDAPTEAITVTGLLRLSEPRGAFLRRNDAAANRWTSRDVAAIAEARGLGPVAPFFVDADAAVPGGPASAPVGGLTVLRFPDNHLVYALTWYALAAMVAGGFGIAVRDERRRRRLGEDASLAAAPTDDAAPG